MSAFESVADMLSKTKHVADVPGQTLLMHIILCGERRLRQSPR